MTRMRILIVLACIVLTYPLSQVEAAVPKPEGTLTAGVYTLAEEGYLPDRGSGSAGPIWESVYDYLIYSDSSTRKPIPGLAERWEYSKDYKTLTFRLRKGVQFHEGWGDLTAEDLKFTIELSSRPTSTNLRSTELRKITSMEMPDRYTLVIHLKEPDPMFWILFCTADSVQLPVLCKKYIETVGEEKANRQPIGSGPYRLVEHKLGDYAKYEAYENHWLVVPEFKYLILRIIPEESTRVAMLKTGEIDIAHSVSLDKMADIEKAGLRCVVKRDSQVVFFGFGGMLLPEDKRYVEGVHRKDPWVDIRVREAMNIAIDRDTLVKSLFRGTATAAPIWATIPGWEDLKPIPYDPKRAKQLLAEAGYPNGFKFKFLTHAKVPELPILGDAVAGYWEAIGLKPETIRGDFAAWTTATRGGKTAGYIWTDNAGNFPDWTGRLASFELPGAATPVWQSEETKAAINKVRAELDLHKRETCYKELARLYRSLYSHIPIVYVPMVHGVGKNVGAWSPGQTNHPKNFIFARHATPLNTYRLFTP